jgi:hypothetical protein
LNENSVQCAIIAAQFLVLEATLGVGGRRITQDDTTTQEPVDIEAGLHEFLHGTYDAPWFNALTDYFMAIAAEAGVDAVDSIIREVSWSAILLQLLREVCTLFAVVPCVSTAQFRDVILDNPAFLLLKTGLQECTVATCDELKRLFVLMYPRMSREDADVPATRE